jgi:hypothetical protein
MQNKCRAVLFAGSGGFQIIIGIAVQALIIAGRKTLIAETLCHGLIPPAKC